MIHYISFTAAHLQIDFFNHKNIINALKQFVPSDVALENTCIVATFSFQPFISQYFSNQLLWAKLDLRKGPRGMRLLPADYNLTVMELHAITRPAPHWPRGTQSLNKGKRTLQCSHCVLQSGAQQRGFNIFQ